MGDAELPKPATQETVVGNMAKGAESMPGLHASTRGCYSPWPCDCIRQLHGPHLNQTAVLVVLRCYTHSPRCRWAIRYGCVRFTAHRHRLITKSSLEASSRHNFVTRFSASRKSQKKRKPKWAAETESAFRFIGSLWRFYRTFRSGEKAIF